MVKKEGVGRTHAWRRTSLSYERRRISAKEKCKEESLQVEVSGQEKKILSEKREN